MAKKIFVKHILLADGWAENVLIEIDEFGIIAKLSKNQVLTSDFEGERVSGSIIPAMVNNHSHAFQWAMAGLAEQSGKGKDSFWSWRKIMYDFVGKISPDDLEAIASALYMQMLKAGYTSVGEFHYLHHDISGSQFANPAEMSQRIFAAAQNTGINVTLLPVFYRYSGFGQQAPNDGQKRFIHSKEDYAKLLNLVARLADKYKQNFGIAPHSLRAVSEADIHYAINQLNELDANAPIHIHIAEQLKEVEDCQAHYGARPIEWLLDNFELNHRWCLVHATHMTYAEVKAVADSNAVVSICTTTEANLGDGFFAMQDYKAHQGRWGIGSDSHISVSATEELRWLEYQNRLLSHSRTVLTGGDFSSNGHYLWSRAAQGGAQSLNNQTGELTVGNKADFIELNNNSLPLLMKSNHELIDSFIFNQQSNQSIASVWCKGQKVVADGEHHAEQAIITNFKKTLARLI
ncbi:formimidoylglutamate deiminase [Kangiella sp. TOML190]|uniref:formimidoylglutamate deiminase n=1 Tax=Kangiella sp. TOML190 TaxID=2931351 RepID=UPI00203CD07A|nr:formimidoylglutamate deiminase [Kangiella sp. TOML190]